MKEPLAREGILDLNSRVIEETDSTVPNRIKILRLRSRLTQKELAKLTDRTPATISRHENGVSPIDDLDIRDYARVFKCQTHELFIAPRTPPPEYNED